MGIPPVPAPPAPEPAVPVNWSSTFDPYDQTAKSELDHFVTGGEAEPYDRRLLLSHSEGLAPEVDVAGRA